jgi:Xaa-Pro aminopeptidase
VEGELIQLNIGARVSGYSPSVGLPICLGKMSAEQRDLVEFGLEAHHQTIDWLKAGTAASSIAQRYKQFIIDRGYGKNFLYGPCHGLGMMEVEQPWMEETSTYPLQSNMTFQVDTFLYGDAFGLRWENGGRVTEDGFDLFGGQFRRVIEVE